MKPYIQSFVLGFISASLLIFPFLTMYGVSPSDAGIFLLISSILGTVGFARAQAPFGIEQEKEKQPERIWIWSMFPSVFFLIIQAGVWMMLRFKSSDVWAKSDRTYMLVGTAVAVTAIWLAVPAYMKRCIRRPNHPLRHKPSRPPVSNSKSPHQGG